MSGFQIRVATLLGVAATFFVLWMTQIPLGVPGEWVWKRIDVADAETVDVWLGLLTGLLAGSAYIGFVWLGVRRLDRASHAETGAWLAGLVLAGAVCVVLVETVPPSPWPEAKTAIVLFSPNSSGYFHEAVTSRQDAGEFLRGYEEKMAAGDVLHIGTHPPGLILLDRGLIAACRRSPALTDIVLATQPRSVERALEEGERSNRKSANPWTAKPLTRAERAALWLAVVLTHFFAAAAVVPLFWIVRQDFGRRAGWMSAAFWPLVPALSVFLPKSDALYPLLGMLFLVTWRSAYRNNSPTRAVLAGMLFWTGLSFSLALLPIGLLAVTLTVWETVAVEDRTLIKRRIRRTLILVGWATAAFAVLTVTAWLTVKVNLFAIWAWNYRNHASFYDQSTRTYWKWLLINPLETGFAFGWPICILALFNLGRLVRFPQRRRNDTELKQRLPRRFIAPVCSCFLVWALLWISGKNMGEAGRLWLFLLPCFLWVASAAWVQTPKNDDAENSTPSLQPRAVSLWIWVLAAQLAACLLTVARVRVFFLFR